MKNKELKKPPKAYKNLDFLNSPDARNVRILAEFIEPATRFRKYRVQDTVVFFGSARVEDRESAKNRLRDLEKSLKGKRKNRKLDQELKAARNGVKLSKYYEDARRLAALLTEWSISLGRGKRRFIIASGGGPGIMEAANRGASETRGGYTVGLNISLPFEQNPNSYITKDLSFEFHYFFIRKYWFLYLAKALVVFPGGFGTLDELFEILTLIQTEKTRKKMPVLIYGTSYWKKLVDFDLMVEQGMISKEDMKLIHFSDDPIKAFEYLRDRLTELYLDGDG
ncbi:MAG: LOG family protein [Planctomycetota bacterium]|jgi:uncharacterized protein (TIGR00730 family)